MDPYLCVIYDLYDIAWPNNTYDTIVERKKILVKKDVCMIFTSWGRCGVA